MTDYYCKNCDDGRKVEGKLEKIMLKSELGCKCNFALIKTNYFCQTCKTDYYKEEVVHDNKHFAVKWRNRTGTNIDGWKH